MGQAAPASADLGVQYREILTDPIWWFWLFWAAPFFHDKFGVDLKHIGLPLIIIYNLASFGSIAGGWIPTGFARLGCSHNMARKVAMLICALLCCGHGYAAGQQRMDCDCPDRCGRGGASGVFRQSFRAQRRSVPRRAVGSVVGIGGMFGAIAGMLFQAAAGRIEDRYHTYLPLFIAAGAAYLLAIAVIHVLAPRLEPARFE